MTKQQISEIESRLTVEDYEKAFPTATKYIKDHIWHGYDAKFYVACRNASGSFFAAQYTKADFYNTFYNYFPREIMLWFNHWRPVLHQGHVEFRQLQAKSLSLQGERAQLFESVFGLQIRQLEVFRKGST
ncbi:MAG: hypothetical protein P4N59_11170 [Negativicutes bacterium]|nr:hypothetical protein [Negativicutes bacterium]